MRLDGATPWLAPLWPAPAGVHAVFTTRAGGASTGPYHSLNLGQHVADDPAQVQANRARLHDALQARPVFLQQVHGREVLLAQDATPDGASADACVTTGTRLACTVLVADCLPVLLASRDGQCVAAAHAGWRGLAAGVLEATVARMRAAQRQHAPQVQPAELLAWLGPCIGPGAFEVGEEVYAAFVDGDPRACSCFKPHAKAGKWWADLPALARLRLADLGLGPVYGNDGSAPWCTVQQPAQFFSYRRDGVCGRMAACIWRS